MVLPLVIYAIYATSFTMSKAILSYLPPLLYVGLRIMTAGVILFGYTVYRSGISSAIDSILASIFPFIKLMLVQTYIPYTLSFIALERVTSVEASLIYNISPCITAIFSYMVLNKRLHWIKIIGLVVSMSALIPLFYNRMISVYTGASGNSEALLLLVVAVTSTTYGWILFSNLYNTSRYDATLVSSFSLFFGGLCILATSSLIESWRVTLGDAIETVSSLFVSLVIAVDIIFTNLYGYLLGYYTATFMALLGITLPIFTSVFSWMFLEETIPYGFIPACCIMSLGLYLFYRGEYQERHTAA